MRFLRPMLRMIPSLLLLLMSPVSARAAQWEPLPLWGDTVDLAAGRHPAVVYAAAYDRLFESFDGGRSWQLVAAGMYELHSRLGNGGVLKVGPQDSRFLYSTDPWPAVGEGGVSRSEDGGRTWVRSDEGMAGLGVTDLAFGPAASGILYAATSGGLYQSKDRGAFWSLLAFPGQSVRHVAVAPSDPRIVLASGWDGKTLWTRRSTDRGRTFVRVLQRSVETYVFDPSRPRRVIGISLAGNNRYALVRSDDLGARWNVLAPLSSPLRTLAITPSGVLLAGALRGGVSRSLNGVTWSPPLTGQGGRPLDVVSSLVMLDAAILAGGEHGVWRSGKAGRTWRLSNQGMQNQEVEVVEVAADEASTVWVGTGAGLFLSRDQGETFQLHGEGMGARGRVLALAVHPADPETAYALGCCVDLAGLSTPGMLKTTDGGRSWRALKYPGFRYGALTLEVDPLDPDIVYAGGFDDSPGRSCTAWRSMDGGEAWSCIAPTGLDFAGLAIDPRDQRILYGLFNGEIYRSEDRGTSWTKGAEGNALMSRIEVDPVQADRLYAYGNGLLRSDDGGRTWSPKLLPLPGGYLFGFVVDPGRPGRIWVTRGDQILRSEDAGDSWTEISSGPGPGIPIVEIALDPRSPDVLYGIAEQRRGLYRLR